MLKSVILTPMTDWAAFVVTVTSEFGEALKRHREAIGMTQAELANRVNLRRTSITNMERGNQVPSLPHVIALAQALRVPLRVLLPSVAAPVGGDETAADRVSEFYSVRDEILKTARHAG